MITFNNKQIRLILLASAVFAALAAILVFGGVIPAFYKKEFGDEAYGPARIEFRYASFYELKGWQQDNHEDAFAAFLRSCSALQTRASDAPANAEEFWGDQLGSASLAGSVGDWKPLCAEADQIKNSSYADPIVTQGAMRVFFENNFQPVQIVETRAPLPDGPARRQKEMLNSKGVFTGYFEPIYDAARSKSAYFSAPVFRRPGDLIDVNLGDFGQDLSGRRAAGRVEGNRLVPYADRRAINNGALNETTSPVAWMAPNDLFFLQIQGSGRLRFKDGIELRIGYDGQNGHTYTAIGRIIVEREIMPLADISMQSIRQWLESASEEEAVELREQNRSYVFFRELEAPQDGLGPPGAQGVALTPGRSLAVDRRYHALGAPIWVDIEPVVGGGREPIRRLMVAQDTGGAIRGPVRGDVFWGAGDEAGEIAGAMNAQGEMYVLVPRSVAARLPKRTAK